MISRRGLFAGITAAVGARKVEATPIPIPLPAESTEARLHGVNWVNPDGIQFAGFDVYVEFPGQKPIYIGRQMRLS